MEETAFRRKIYQEFLQWKQESNGKTALLVEGARRIGKSTIVREFARREYETYILIDFNKASATVKSLFDDLMDLDYIFLTLQAAYRTKLHERKSVIVFDEVQKCPMARQAIKYLVEDGRYDYIETGSLISIRKNTRDITIPSEEERLQMHPMDYEEFRWALGDDATMPLLQSFWERKRPLGAAFRTAMRDFRLYMLIGGMPQAVNAYLQTKDLGRVDKVKRGIIQLYEEDFHKIDSSGKLSKLYHAIPGQLNRKAKRFVASSVIGKAEEEKMTDLLSALEDSKTVNLVYHADDPNVGMGLTKNMDQFKVYAADTGLFVTLAFWDKSFTENSIYQKLLSDKLSANLGFVYENMIAQMLAAAGNALFYYTWPKDEKHYYEIDFLLSRGTKLCPIEVKSSGYNTHASLNAFCEKFASRIGERYLLYTKDLNKDGPVTLTPAFLTPMI